ncbi:MAG: hypothetical protein RBS78_05430 [Coriobacteriia bacterium]|nr:hypothetical protein [Coriobacteriia bacterium]
MWDWFALTFWDFSSFILWIAIFLLGFGAARLLFLTLAHRMPVKRSGIIAGATLLGVAVIFALSSAWATGRIVPDSEPEPFNAETWESKPWVRYAMAQHMVESGELLGMRREEMWSMLGYGDGSYSDPSGIGTDMQAWRLWRPRDLLLVLPPELRLDYDQRGRVIRAWVEPGVPHFE